MRESNSHQRFWRPLSYHLTNPLQVYFIYSQNYIHADISLKIITSCVADWVLYSSGGHFVTSSLSVICFANDQSVSGTLLQKQACFESFLLHPAASSASWSSPHPISNSQLHALLHFHLCPIYLVVFKGVYFSKEWDISSWGGLHA